MEPDFIIKNAILTYKHLIWQVLGIHLKIKMFHFMNCNLFIWVVHKSLKFIPLIKLDTVVSKYWFDIILH